MIVVITILLIVVCAVLAFFVLIQNPKGGGLSGSFGGLGNQMMGVKQSTDVVEKGTWYTAAVMAILILLSFVFAPRTNTTSTKLLSEEALKGAPISAPKPAAAPAPTATMPTAVSPEEAAKAAAQAGKQVSGQAAQQPAAAQAQQAPTQKTDAPMSKELMEAKMKQQAAQKK